MPRVLLGAAVWGYLALLCCIGNQLVIWGLTAQVGYICNSNGCRFCYPKLASNLWLVFEVYISRIANLIYWQAYCSSCLRLKLFSCGWTSGVCYSSVFRRASTKHNISFFIYLVLFPCEFWNLTYLSLVLLVGNGAIASNVPQLWIETNEIRRLRAGDEDFIQRSGGCNPHHQLRPEEQEGGGDEP
jgi:hypothetical protein